jgi:putative acyl-CoA dehydrogenase
LRRGALSIICNQSGSYPSNHGKETSIFCFENRSHACTSCSKLGRTLAAVSFFFCTFCAARHKKTRSLHKRGEHRSAHIGETHRTSESHPFKKLCCFQASNQMTTALHTKKPFHRIDSPRLGNQFLEDSALRFYLENFVPKDILESMTPELIHWGDRCVQDLNQMGAQAEANPPSLTQYNAWGDRVDIINTAEGFWRMKEVTAREGLVAIPFERKYKEFSTLLHFAKLYMLVGAQGISYSCLIGMTNGAAKVCELLLHNQMKNQNLAPKALEFVKECFEHFTSRDPQVFWDSGQWMTEKTGGSDVSGSETIAVPDANVPGLYYLSGYKFFTSGTTSDVTMTLAKIVRPGQDPKTARLSLFLLKLRDNEGRLNNILIHRLKHKMGTRALPTAELEMVGTPAWLISPEGHGVSYISPLLNITRVGSATTTVGMMRRAIALVRDYAFRRRVFGKLLAEQPLHLHTLATLEVEYRGCLLFCMRVSQLSGSYSVRSAHLSEETINRDPAARNEANLIRILAPLLKLYVCKVGVGVINEAMECLGGTGYMEDSRMPLLLRDAQVNCIWEGTTNVVAMDVLRVLHNQPEAFVALISDCYRLLNEIATSTSTSQDSQIQSAIKQTKNAVDFLEGFAKLLLRKLSENERYLAIIRSFAFSLARTYTACLLLNVSDKQNGLPDDRHVHRITTLRWCAQPLVLIEEPYKSLSNREVSDSGEGDKLLALDSVHYDSFHNRPRAKM